jgi:hypothetical protein
MDARHSIDSIHSINDDGHEEPRIFESIKSSIGDSARSLFKNYEGDSGRDRERRSSKGFKMELEKGKEKKRGEVALTNIKIN